MTPDQLIIVIACQSLYTSIVKREFIITQTFKSSDFMFWFSLQIGSATNLELN